MAYDEEYPLCDCAFREIGTHVTSCFLHPAAKLAEHALLVDNPKVVKGLKMSKNRRQTMTDGEYLPCDCAFRRIGKHVVSCPLHPAAKPAAKPAASTLLSEDPMIMYLIVRKSIRMSPAKLAVQVGHAVQMIMEARLGLRSPPGDIDDMITWLETGYTKALFGVSEKDWVKAKSIPGVRIVTDLSKTELAPGIETVGVLWPMRKSQVGKLFSRFQLLKAPSLEEAFGVFGRGLEQPWQVLASTLRAGLPGQPAGEIGYDEQLIQDIANAVLEWKERKTS